ncbi:flavoprotein [Limtongia smithiae]|uniref:flavoprotein n=1 Tax=Limtongia smithiae TaxID=1125753 RepID=UPI0034CEFCB7
MADAFAFAPEAATPPASLDGPTPPFGTTISAPHPNLPLNDGKLHLLLAASGSVATIKVPLIVEKLYRIYEPSRISIQIVLTKSAERFLPAADKPLPAHIHVWRDSDEWNSWSDRSDPIVHIELRRWAHLLLIAPLSANTLAKIAAGICDNLLTSVVRAWNPAMPIWLAPAMNTYMYTNPLTRRHLRLITEEMEWIKVLRPVEKVLACGDIGMGGMREWADIVEMVVAQFPPKKYPIAMLEPLADTQGLIHERSRHVSPDIPNGHVRFQDEVDDALERSEVASIKS